MSDLANKILSDADEKMSKAVEVAKEDFGAIRTGRAHPSMFAKIMVDYYGTFTPLSQLASVQVPEARMAGSAFKSNRSASKRIFSSNNSTFIPFLAEISWHWYFPPHSSTKISN